MEGKRVLDCLLLPLAKRKSQDNLDTMEQEDRGPGYLGQEDRGAGYLGAPLQVPPSASP